jgi:hypothetical protein
MTDVDEKNFLDMLFARTDTHVLKGDCFRTSTPAPCSRSKIGKAGELTLVNSDVMQRPRAHAVGSGEFERYRFDMFRDPTIEFIRCSVKKGRLISGRIYAKIGWLQPKKLNAVYQAWYSAIERWLKKKYRRVHRYWWFGPEAWNWSMKGGVCCYGDEIAFSGSLRELGSDWIEDKK